MRWRYVYALAVRETATMLPAIQQDLRLQGGPTLLVKERLLFLSNATHAAVRRW